MMGVWNRTADKYPQKDQPVVVIGHKGAFRIAILESLFTTSDGKGHTLWHMVGTRGKKVSDIPYWMEIPDLDIEEGKR